MSEIQLEFWNCCNNCSFCCLFAVGLSYGNWFSVPSLGIPTWYLVLPLLASHLPFSVSFSYIVLAAAAQSSVSKYFMFYFRFIYYSSIDIDPITQTISLKYSVNLPKTIIKIPIINPSSSSTAFAMGNNFQPVYYVARSTNNWIHIDFIIYGEQTIYHICMNVVCNYARVAQ